MEKVPWMLAMLQNKVLGEIVIDPILLEGIVIVAKQKMQQEKQRKLWV